MAKFIGDPVILQHMREDLNKTGVDIFNFTNIHEKFIDLVKSFIEENSSYQVHRAHYDENNILQIELAPKPMKCCIIDITIDKEICEDGN